jgi:hypothetical protein
MCGLASAAVTGSAPIPAISWASAPTPQGQAAVKQERQAAEHLDLGRGRFVGELVTYAVGEVFVVGDGLTLKGNRAATGVGLGLLLTRFSGAR